MLLRGSHCKINLPFRFVIAPCLDDKQRGLQARAALGAQMKSPMCPTPNYFILSPRTLPHVATVRVRLVHNATIPCRKQGNDKATPRQQHGRVLQHEMVMTWRHHGTGMARPWQWHCKGIAKARQRHGEDTGRTRQWHGNAAHGTAMTWQWHGRVVAVARHGRGRDVARTWR